MPRLAGLLTLAIVAALLAPSSVFAATPSNLRDGAASPSEGTVDAPVTLSVRYTAPDGHPATAVTASVAGLVVPLSLVSGTSADGTWAASAWLPTGTWPVTFQASTSKGDSVSVELDSVVAIGAAPSDSPSSAPPDPAIRPGGAGPTPALAPRHSTEPSRQPSGNGPRSTAPSPDPDPSLRGRGKEDGNRGRPRRGARGTSSPDGAAASPVATASGATTTPSSAVPTAPDMLTAVLLLGLAGVTAVALGGGAWALVAGRRQRATETISGRSPLGGRDPAIDAMPAADRRAIRRARLRAGEDPILAGMGLDAPAEDGSTATKASEPNGDRPRARGRRAKRR